ncbi:MULTISPECIES: LysE family translocator [Deefgea]|uniref:LysE family translocator n=1 Tax=Deefgea chitinilytica TaxID=570276 RepID=A0ABS2CFH6_9NEIS|nr:MULTISPECIES: LysE family translocator [Deefgea]MBM5572904.1 LysE family translocator [Deefgea chitinilytica]MBM9890140.1 LysE family translocator [Deefgea sp. CFH1-16]
MLLAPEQFFGFLSAAVLITLSPGPDNLMVLSIGATRGRLRGMAFGMGCALGCLSHTLLATLGISALIAASPIAFSVLKIIGGVYLIYLGWLALKSRGGATVGTSSSQENAGKLFWRGVFANSINPKVVLFFLAFLPQFVDAARHDTGWQILQLGIIFTLQAILLFGSLGFFAGSIGRYLNQHASVSAWLDRTAGSIFVVLGLRLIIHP